MALFAAMWSLPLEEELERYVSHEDQYPVNNWLNDIFAARIILTSDEIDAVMNVLDDWQNELNLQKWYFCYKAGYRGLHVYFKNRSNFYFPWELQVWDVADMRSNIENHEKFKGGFKNEVQHRLQGTESKVPYKY